MFSSVFVRILWKEYRAQRNLWLAMAFVGICLELIAIWNYSTSWRFEHDRSVRLEDVLFATSRIVLAIYVASTSAILFGAELEDRTLSSLRDWGIAFTPLVLGKLVFCFLSSACLTVFVEALARVSVGHWLMSTEGEQLHNRFWTIELLAVVAAISVLLSQLSGRVLISVVGTLLLALPLFTLKAWPPIAGSLVLVAGVLVWSRLSPSFTIHRFGALRPKMIWPSRSLVWPNETEAAGPMGRVFRRLIWQESRNALRILRWAGMAVLLAAAMSWLAFGNNAFSSFRELLWLLSTAAVAILPVFIFHGEWYLERYRFLSERDAPALAVWLSKLVVWTPLLAGFELSIVLLILFDQASRSEEVSWWTIFHKLWSISGFLVLCFATGQFISFSMRKPTMAGVVMVVVNVAVYVWWHAATTLSVPGGLSTIAPVAILLAGSLVATQNCLEERRGWNRLRPLIIALGAPFVVLCAGIATYRVFEIRWNVGDEEQIFVGNLGAQDLSDGLETAVMYDQIYAAMHTLKKLPLDAPEFKRLHEIVERPNLCQEGIPSSGEIEPRATKLEFLAGALLTRGDEFQNASQPDQAIDDYLHALLISRHSMLSGGIDGRLKAFAIEGQVFAAIMRWSGSPKASVLRLKTALQGLERCFSEIPSLNHSVRLEYLLRKQVVKERPDLVGREFQHSDALFETLHPLFELCPWERGRACDLLNHLGIVDSILANELEAAGAGDFDAIRMRMEVENDFEASPFRRRSGKARRLVASTPLMGWFNALPILELMNADHAARTRRNAIRLILAICAWRLENGTLPENLEQAKAAYLAPIARSEMQDDAFEYAREGTVTIQEKSRPAPAIVNRRPIHHSQGNVSWIPSRCWSGAPILPTVVEAAYYAIPLPKTEAAK